MKLSPARCNSSPKIHYELGNRIPVPSTMYSKTNSFYEKGYLCKTLS